MDTCPDCGRAKKVSSARCRQCHIKLAGAIRLSRPIHRRPSKDVVYNEGRAYLLLHGHHLADKKGYVLRYRLVAEESIGRRLLPGEVVHHINGIKDDDRPENLRVMTLSEHASLHIQQGDYPTFGGAHPRSSSAGGAGVAAASVTRS